MNNEYIADGEIHAFDETFAYILKFIHYPIRIEDWEKSKENTLFEFCQKHAEYLMKFDEGLVLILLVRQLMKDLKENINEWGDLTIREPLIESMICQPASIALKFRRTFPDNL